MLISKSRYLSLFNVFFFLDEIFYHFLKSRGPRASRTCLDQGPHTVFGKLLLILLNDCSKNTNNIPCLTARQLCFGLLQEIMNLGELLHVFFIIMNLSAIFLQTTAFHFVALSINEVFLQQDIVILIC